jgi:hypothetical protein
MRVKVITGVAVDQNLGFLNLRAVRVGGTANLAAAVTVKQGSTVLHTFAIAAVPGTEVMFHDLSFNQDQGQLVLGMANAADTMLFFYT